MSCCVRARVYADELLLIMVFTCTCCSAVLGTMEVQVQLSSITDAGQPITNQNSVQFRVFNVALALASAIVI